MGIESARSPGVPDRNGETSETGGYSDGKALSYSSCRLQFAVSSAVGRRVNCPWRRPSARGQNAINHCESCAGFAGGSSERSPAVNIPIFDADSHLSEVPDLWTSRMSEAKWGDAIPHVAFDERIGRDRCYVAGKKLTTVASWAPAGWHSPPPGHPPTIAEGDPAAFYVEPRLAKMDNYGIYSQVIYPNLLAFSGCHVSPTSIGARSSRGSRNSDGPSTSTMGSPSSRKMSSEPSDASSFSTGDVVMVNGGLTSLSSYPDDMATVEV